MVDSFSKSFMKSALFEMLNVEKKVANHRKAGKWDEGEQYNQSLSHKSHTYPREKGFYLRTLSYYLSKSK